MQLLAYRNISNVSFIQELAARSLKLDLSEIIFEHQLYMNYLCYNFLIETKTELE